nr:MAG TPA: hypothetical protein [Bacteriophage sp.]
MEYPQSLRQSNRQHMAKTAKSISLQEHKMSFCDITIAQRNANYTNIADTSAQLVSLNSDGSAVLKIGTETAQFIVQNLSQANAKQVLISTGSVLFLAGNYNAPNLECSLVRIVEAAVEESVDEPTTLPAE